jgi:hypothetical protein
MNCSICHTSIDYDEAFTSSDGALICETCDRDNYEPTAECPCGCGDNVEHCSYASICMTCTKKYYGYGYGDRSHQCPDCIKAREDAFFSHTQ